MKIRAVNQTLCTECVRDFELTLREYMREKPFSTPLPLQTKQLVRPCAYCGTWKTDDGMLFWVPITTTLLYEAAKAVHEQGRCSLL